MYRVLAMSAALMLGGGAAWAQQSGADNGLDRARDVFERMDFNRDGKLNLQEFGLGSRELDLFDKYDADSDQRIDGREFEAVSDGDFGAWDINGNGYLEESEFLEGLFRAWDGNSDGYLTEEEWRAAGERGAFDHP